MKTNSIIICLAILVSTATSFADTSYDILKLIGPRYEKTKQHEYNLEFQTGYALKNESTPGYYYGNEETKMSLNAIRVYMAYGITNELQCHLDVPMVYIKEERTSYEDKSGSGLGDASAGFAFKRNMNEGLMVLDLTYTTPNGSSPFEVNTNDELPTGNGFHSLKPEIAFFKFIGPAVLYGIGNIQYSLPEDNLSQLRNGPEGSYSVLKKVTPGHVIGLNLGTAVDFNKAFAANWGLAFRQYAKNKYNWQSGTRNTGKEITTAYFYAGAIMTMNNYTFFPKLTIGTTDDSYDFGFSIRLPLL